MLSDDNSIRSICTETDIIAHIERAHTQHKGIAKAMCDISQTPPHLSTSQTYSLSTSLLSFSSSSVAHHNAAPCFRSDHCA